MRMSPQPEPLTQEVLAGLVERVTYHNAENGFCVLRARARGHRDVVTVVGYAATISAGEWITASGEWVNDRTHGQQFKARFLRTSPPTSADGIKKYLSSGMIRGVGPVYAKKLVCAFGDRENYFRWLAFRRLDACYPNEMPAPATRLPIGTIATARDSWSRMVLLARLRAPGQQQAQALVSQRASFSSQSASSASPPAGPREPGWA